MGKIINSSMTVGSNSHCISFNIPEIKSIRVAHENYPEEPEVDFNRTLDDGALGIKDNDLYYVTVPLVCDIHVVTKDQYKIIECMSHRIREIDFPALAGK